jgi:hypothetical protein
MISIKELTLVRLEIFRDGIGKFRLVGNGKRGNNVFGFSVDRKHIEEVNKTLVVLYKNSIINHIVTSNKRKEKTTRYKITFNADSDADCEVLYKHQFSPWINSYLLYGTLDKLSRGRFCYIHNSLDTTISNVNLIVNTRKVMENRRPPMRYEEAEESLGVVRVSAPNKYQQEIQNILMDERQYVFFMDRMLQYNDVKTVGDFSIESEKTCRCLMPTPKLNIESIDDIVFTVHDAYLKNTNPTTYAKIKYLEDLIGGNLEIELPNLSISTQIPDNIENEISYIPLRKNIKCFISTETKLTNTSYEIKGMKRSKNRNSYHEYIFEIKEVSEYTLTIFWKNAKNSAIYVFLDLRNILLDEVSEYVNSIITIKNSRFLSIPLIFETNIPLIPEKNTKKVVYHIENMRDWNINDFPMDELSRVRNISGDDNNKFFDMMGKRKQKMTESGEMNRNEPEFTFK